jgi:hypothetical protein
MQTPDIQKDYERAFHGLAFPTSLSAVMKQASDHGGLNREVIEVIGRLPDRQYVSLEDLLAEVQQAYASEATSPGPPSP